MRIRKAVTEDAQRLAQVEAICFPESEAASLESIRNRLQVFAECFWVMEEDGVIIDIPPSRTRCHRTVFHVA